MNAFSFRPAPTYRAASPDEQMTAAFDMPMSLLSTLGQQAKGGILDSFGLGTAVRTVATPETAPVESGSGIADTLGSINRAIAPENMIRRAIGKGYDGSPVLDEDKYKSSAYYRDGVKWDAGMTEDRAAALAESFDAKRVRDHFASKRPITAFIGNIAGQALDPINYIPIMGQTVKAANVARFGRVGGAAITNAIDAAANTALAGALTYSARKDFGDDITWQSTVSEIAMSALIGGAFGGVSGVLDSRRAARAANATAKASEALSTLKNVQDARVALNSAIDGLVRGEDVNLSANAVDAVTRISSDPNVAMADVAGMSNAANRDAVLLSNDNDALLKSRSYSIDEFTPDEQRNIITGASDRAEAMVLTAQELRKAVSERSAIASLRETNQVGFDGTPILEASSPDGTYRGRGKLADDMPAKGHEGFTVAEREGILSELDGKIQRLESAVKSDVPTASNLDIVRVARSVRRPVASVDASTAKPEPLPIERAEAEARVATPENYKAASEQYGVNADDGTFIEQADVDKMRNDGRLTPDDEAALVEAETTYENGLSYGEALKAVVGCLLA